MGNRKVMLNLHPSVFSFQCFVELSTRRSNVFNFAISRCWKIQGSENKDTKVVERTETDRLLHDIATTKSTLYKNNDFHQSK